MKLNYSINQINRTHLIYYFVGSGQCSKQLQEALETEIKNNQDLQHREIKKMHVGEELIKMSKTIKIVFLGDGGSGKTTILQSFEKSKKRFNFSSDHLNTTTTTGIEYHQKGVLGIDNDVNYQIWDFAGQLEYGVIHQHFLSTGSIYIVVISLAREVKPQFDYWINFLQSIVDLSECSIIVVGSKSDLLEKPKLESVTKELNGLILEYNNQYKTKDIQIEKEVIIVSAVNLSGFKNLQKSIQYSKISTNFKEIPRSLHFFDNY